MRKRFYSLLLAAALLAAPMTSVYADHYEGGSDWYVRFDDKNNTTLTSNFSTGDMDSLVSDMQPGDDVTFNVKVQNTMPDQVTVDYYMRNDILKSFETSEAEGAIYTYKLYYTTSDGTVKTFYDNGEVGGDASEGLMEADTELEDFFFLDELDYNEEGTLTLQVSLDGETQRNDYQDTMAKLMLQFQVELPQKGEDTTTIKKIYKTNTTTSKVQTGDSMHLAILSIVGAAAGILLLVIAIILVKRNKNDEEEQKA